MSKNDNLTFDFDYIHALYSYITSVKAYSVQKQAMDIYACDIAIKRMNIIKIER